MDALSDVLRAVRLSGAVFLEAEFTAPWCITSRLSPEDCRPFVVNPQHIIAYHYVVEGRVLVQAAGEAPVQLRAGEIVLLPRNDEHCMGSEITSRPVRGDKLVQTPDNGGLMRIVHGGGGERTRIVCGFLGSEVKHNPVLAALPRVLTLDVRRTGAAQWIESSFHFAAAEVGAGRAGAGTVLSKLSELLFVEAVRQYVDALPSERRGWLAGLRDPYVGRALALMHARLAHPWTAEDLAQQVGLSRSAFAERFTGIIGDPPLRYLAAWRMQLASQRLSDSHLPIAQIAYEIGYESEAAFNRAFKREFGTPPAAWRRQAKNVPPAAEARPDSATAAQ
jgi:AraC-like DNA-binding protein